MRKFRTSAVDAGQALGVWLAARLGDTGAADLVTRGAVYVDGRRVRDPATVLRAQQSVAVHDEPAARAPATFRVVYEDVDVLVVDKPAGIPTQATREDAAGALDEAVAARTPGARLLHRLDRDASGLVMFTVRDESRGRLQRALDDGRIEREYAAIVAGVPTADEGTLDAPIGKDPSDPRKRRAGVPGGESARTHVRVLRRGLESDAAWLAVTLDTGRTHQIRVHLAHAGHPILGDLLYAPLSVQARAPRLCLHAVRLTWPGGDARSAAPADWTALTL